MTARQSRDVHNGNCDATDRRELYDPQKISRRALFALAAAGAMTRCRRGPEMSRVPAEAGPTLEEWRSGRLTTRPNPSDRHSGVSAAPWLYVPPSVKNPAPVLVALHGAGGRGSRTMRFMRGHADHVGAVLIVPESLGRTWDAIGGELGVDVERIDGQLEQTFDSFAVDERRIAVSGFSDGGSYALTLGIGNGDLFTHVIAFSPCFAAATREVGKPRFFLSHGTGDEILPIDRCSRRLVPHLRGAGYDVQYREFDGGHTVPGEVLDEAMKWFVG